MHGVLLGIGQQLRGSAALAVKKFSQYPTMLKLKIKDFCKLDHHLLSQEFRDNCLTILNIGSLRIKSLLYFLFITYSTWYFTWEILIAFCLFRWRYFLLLCTDSVISTDIEKSSNLLSYFVHDSFLVRGKIQYFKYAFTAAFTTMCNRVILTW